MLVFTSGEESACLWDHLGCSQYEFSWDLYLIYMTLVEHDLYVQYLIHLCIITLYLFMVIAHALFIYGSATQLR